jgi:hypothetical protein
LKDLPPGAIKHMMEDIGLPLSAVIGLNVISESENGDTVSMLTKLLHRRSMVSENIKSWKQVALSKIYIAPHSLADGREVYDIVAKKLYHLLEMKSNYDTYFNDAPLLQLPKFTPGSGKVNQTEVYKRLTEEWIPEQFITLEFILDAMVEQVVATCTKEEEKEDLMEPNKDETLDEFVAYLDAIMNGVLKKDTSESMKLRNLFHGYVYV